MASGAAASASWKSSPPAGESFPKRSQPHLSIARVSRWSRPWTGGMPSACSRRALLVPVVVVGEVTVLVLLAAAAGAGIVAAGGGRAAA